MCSESQRGAQTCEAAWELPPAACRLWHSRLSTGGKRRARGACAGVRAYVSMPVVPLLPAQCIRQLIRPVHPVPVHQLVRCKAATSKFPGMLASPVQQPLLRSVQQGVERLQRWLLDFWVVLGEKLKNYTQRLRGRVQPRIYIDPLNVQQNFEGFGTSLCWFANILGNAEHVISTGGVRGLPAQLPVRDFVADLLFDPDKGLGLQICRYNIGGSGWQTIDVGNLRFGANVDSFWGPDREWDWSLDAGQRWMLLAARARGACIFEAFSNSPPYWMTKSGRASGSAHGKASHDNLAPGHYDLFVQYLVEVVRWYRDNHRLIFRTLDPFNEPNTNYWWAGNNQEGCHFDPKTQSIILEKLHAALQEAGLLKAGTSLAASDETSIDTACSTLRSYSPGALKAITQVNAHAYEGTQRQQLQALAKRAGKRLWMSEWGCGPAPLDDIGSAVHLAAGIIRDLNELQAQAWVYWQAVENSETGNWWGLMQVPFHKPVDVTLGKQYWAMMHYSRFIRRGFTILSTNNPENVVAAVSPKSSGSKVTAVVVTASGPAQLFEARRLISYDFTAFGSKGEAEVQIWRTSHEENMRCIQAFLCPAPVKFSIVIPPMSMTTVTMRIKQQYKTPRAEAQSRKTEASGELV